MSGKRKKAASPSGPSVDSSGLSYLFVCVCLPSFSDYLNTLGELHGFIASQAHDVLLIACDFNVDFNFSCSLHSLLVDFLSDLDLTVCDLSFESSVGRMVGHPENVHPYRRSISKS